MTRVEAIGKLKDRASAIRAIGMREITLVLDTAEVHLKAGDTVVQRGTDHAWSNRSNRPCTIAFSSHDAVSLR